MKVVHFKQYFLFSLFFGALTFFFCNNVLSPPTEEGYIFTSVCLFDQ